MAGVLGAVVRQSFEGKPISVKKGMSVDLLLLHNCTIQLLGDGDSREVKFIMEILDPMKPEAVRRTLVTVRLADNDARTLGEALVAIAPPDTRKRISADEVTCIDYGSLDRGDE